MTPEVLVQHYSRYIADSKENREAFFAHWEPITFPAGSTITKLDSIENWFYYISEGYSYMWYPHKGEQQVVGFSYNGDYGGVYDSFLSRQPARFGYEAFTDVKGLRISNAAMREAYDCVSGLDRWGRQFMEQLFIGRVSREMELSSLTAEQRLNGLWTRSRHLFNVIPQKLLASYLSMTPETFSRLRKNLI